MPPRGIGRTELAMRHMAGISYNTSLDPADRSIADRFEIVPVGEGRSARGRVAIYDW